MRSILVVVTLLGLSLAGTSVADHPQTAGSHATAFDHKAGNEWWVEVRVPGAPAAVQARDDGGDWKTLTLRSWGAWAASFHIEPGHRVQFRATWTDGASIESCWFTHPAGTEQCEGSGNGGGGSGNETGAFAFAYRGGNGWWVETRITPEPSAVEAMDTGGAWTTLTKRSWGAWAGSFRIEPGHEVKFRARSAAGAWQESCWYAHPSGVERCERGGTTTWPREGSYVKYLIDEGESVPGYSSDRAVWANWTYTGGAWRGTCEGWETKWTEYGGETSERIGPSPANATPPVGNPRQVQPGQQVTIRTPSCESHVTGETLYVDGRDQIANYHGSEAYRENGAPANVTVWRASYEDDGCPCRWESASWHPDLGLTIDSGWGGRYSGGGAHLIDTDAPISNATTPPRPAWPVEGSFAVYHVNETDDEGVVVGSRVARFAYAGDKWTMTCSDRPGETYAEAPPMGPATTTVGARVRPTEAWGCQITPPPVVVQGKFPQDTTRNGQRFRAQVWWADESPDTYGDEDAWFDTKVGLLLKWEDNGGYFRGDSGYLTNTDAPLASG